MPVTQSDGISLPQTLLGATESPYRSRLTSITEDEEENIAMNPAAVRLSWADQNGNLPARARSRRGSSVWEMPPSKLTTLLMAGDEDVEEAPPLPIKSKGTVTWLSSDTIIQSCTWYNATSALLCIFLVLFFILMMIRTDIEFRGRHYTVLEERELTLNLSNNQRFSMLELILDGSFDILKPSNETENITITVGPHGAGGQNSNGTWSQTWTLAVRYADDPEAEPELHRTKFFSLPSISDEESRDIEVKFTTTAPFPFSFEFKHRWLHGATKHRVTLAVIVLASVFILITFEVVHRTMASLLGATAAIAVMAGLNMRPSLEEVVTWIDFETLSLLFGMMVIVSVVCETGFFDYCTVLAYKVAKGKQWPLITMLCVFTAVVSAFLDNVTTILLFSPVTIRLCEVMNMNPRSILIAEVLFSNIGGTATPIGDPPNVIIISNKQITERGISFARFTMHMLPGILFVSVACYLLMRLTFNTWKMGGATNLDDEIAQETNVWLTTARKVSVYTKEEAKVKAMLLRQAASSERRMSILSTSDPTMRRAAKADAFKQRIADLELKYRITNRWMLARCAAVLSVIMGLFFMHSFITGVHLTLGWIAIFGAFLLISLSETRDLESVLQRVEWTTLLFFAGLFVLMEALAELGLIDYIGEVTVDAIVMVESRYRLPVAILLIIWVSALASSFMDNIPFTTAMVPVIIQLSEDPKLNLPLQPLVWSLAFGACLGGNGTLIGASANVVGAGIAEQHGYKFSFLDFFKAGFPMMLVSVCVATCYLMICHIAIGWNS